MRQRRPRRLNPDGGGAGFHRQRQNARAVAQRRAIIGAPDLRVIRPGAVHHPRGAGEHRIRPRLIAVRGQRRAELRRRQRGGEIIALHIGIIAQITDGRRPFARQHHQRIGQIGTAAVGACVEIGGVIHLIAQVVHRHAEGDIGHRIALFARPAEEVGDIGIQPEITAGGRPEAKGAAGILIGQHRLDRMVDPVIEIGGAAQPHRPRHIREIEKRQRFRGDLLRAAIGVGIERSQKRPGVKPRHRPHRGGDRGRAGPQPLKERRVERQALPGRQFQPRLPLHRRVQRLHRDGQLLFQELAIRRGQRDAQGLNPLRAACGDR